MQSAVFPKIYSPQITHQEIIAPAANTHGKSYLETPLASICSE